MASFQLLLRLLPLLLQTTYLAHGLLQEANTLFPSGTKFERSSFPQDFLFGTLTSSMKHEGAEFQDGKSENIWDTWARGDYGFKVDDSIPGQCGDNYNRYKGDHKLISGLGMNAYRLSLAWSRIYPNGSGEVNEEAIAHYSDVLDNVIEEGLEPFVTLWTQDHPSVLDATYGGPLNRQFIDDFARYAQTCFNAFGDRVKYWITLDEPNDYAGMGYATDSYPPGRCTECNAGDSGTEPYIVGHNLLLAHAAAAEIYKNQYQAAQNGSIGLALWLRWYVPWSNSSSDIEAAQRATDFLLGWFLDPIFFGDYPHVMRTRVGSRLPNFSENEISRLHGSLDFIGLNIITAQYVYEYDFYTTANVSLSYYLDWKVNRTYYDIHGHKIGKGDGEPSVPWAFRNAMHYIKSHYQNYPLYITEIGYGIDNVPLNVTLDDDERVEYFEEHYIQLSEAIRDGVNVKGVFAWSFIDGYEFIIGLTIRFGIYYVDDDMQRYPRQSALWFKEMISKRDSIFSV